MQTTISPHSSRNAQDAYAPHRRYNDRLSVRRDNSQDEFVAPVKTRSASLKPRAPATAAAAKPEFEGPPPGLFNRFFIWACTALFGRR